MRARGSEAPARCPSSTTMRWACPKPWSKRPVVATSCPRAARPPPTPGARAPSRATAVPRGVGPDRKPRGLLLGREAEPARGDGSGRRLAVPERAGQELQQDLRLRVAAHRAEHRGEASVEGGDERRGQRVRRPPARRVLRRVALLEREAEPAVVQVDAGRRLEQVAPEARGVRLDERDADAGRRRRRTGAVVSPLSRASIRGGDGAVEVDRTAPRRRGVRSTASASPSARVVQHRGAVDGRPASTPRSAGAPRADRRGRRAAAALGDPRAERGR